MANTVERREPFGTTSHSLFLTIAEELNFSRAAEKLHIAQSPLSQQIRELEEELGVKLFYRTNRQVELTNAGKVFQKKAAEILEQVE